MVATIIITLWSMYIRNSNVRVVMGLSHIAEPGSDMASLHHLNQFRRVAVLDCVLRLCAFSALLFWFVVSLHVYIVSLSFSSASAEKLFLSALCPACMRFLSRVFVLSLHIRGVRLSKEVCEGQVCISSA